MTTEKYRRIALEPFDAPDANTDAAVAALNSRFNPDDFYVVHNGGNMEVWLRQLNLGELSAAVEEIQANYFKELNPEVLEYAIERFSRLLAPFV